MPKPKPCCQTLYPWLKANLSPRCLAPLTGRDDKALAAAVHIVHLYGYDEDESVAQAFGLIVNRMQPSTQELAFHAIAHILNWDTRMELWALAKLPPLKSVQKCVYES